MPSSVPDAPGARLLDAVAVMDTLRRECPWDQKQTHSSLLRYLLEEAYEAAEAIETSDFAAMREELGDVLLQVLFHARVASERSAEDGGFTIDDVADTLTAKLRRRHPHVFGSVSVSSADDVNQNWEEIKKAEKAARASEAGAGPPSVLDGVVFGQPALSLAAQLQRRAERAGIPVSAGDAPSPSPSPSPAPAPASASASAPGAPRSASAYPSPSSPSPGSASVGGSPTPSAGDGFLSRGGSSSPGASSPSVGDSSSPASPEGISSSPPASPEGISSSPTSGDSSSPTSGDIGAELMRVVARARAAGVDPELALREAARGFADQVREAERSNPDR